MSATAAQVARFFDSEEILPDPEGTTPLQVLQRELLTVFRVARQELDPETQRTLLDFGIEVIAREARRRWA